MSPAMSPTVPVRLGLSAAFLLLQGSAGMAAPPLASAYTRHDFSTCRALPSPHPDVVEVRRCAGLGGIPVVWTNEPDASAVAFGRTEESGPIPGLDTFFAVRGTIEWRGPATGAGLRPRAAIVRYDTGPSIRLGASRLVVYRLVPGGACVMGVLDGAAPTANAAARALVDRAAAGFVCGRSKARIAPPASRTGT
ncbi:hypothetical protein [Methylobacterium sp. Leaf118]|uniref:hypothetical protein n=1 Tax=Methylobacterium sp. Leaf118 TaxID=2876562 RepID=UPI001E32882F|nr:hypothetical protein [Methylobacterium sp. Leaf118]